MRARGATRPAAACSAVTSASRCCAAATAARASSSSPASRRCSSAERSRSARPASQAERVAVGRPLRGGPGVAARPSAMRRSVRWARASSAAPAASSARRRASSTAAAVTTPVAERTRQPVAAKRSPSGVTTTRSSRASERSMASSQPSTRTARPTSVSSTDSATAPPWRARTWRRTGSALLPGGQVARRGRRPTTGRGVSTAPVTPRSRSVASAAWAERRPSTTTAATPAPAAASKAASQPSSISTRSTSEPTTPSTSRSSSRPPAPCRSDSARSSASARAAVRWRASSASSAADLRRLGRPRGRLQLRGARRQLGLQRRRWPARARSACCQQVGPHGGGGVPLLERADPGAQGVEVLLLAGGGAGHQLACGPGPAAIAWSGGVAAEDGRPALPQRGGLLVERRASRRQLGPLGRAARRLLGLGRGQLAGQAGRLGLERRDHVDVGGGVEGGHHGPAPLAQHAREPAGPLHQALHPAQRVGQVLLAARRQLGRGRGGLGVELLERLVQLALLVAAHGQALRGGPAPGREVGQLGAGQVAAHRQQLGGHACRASGRPPPDAPGGGSGAAPRAPGRPGARGSRPWRPAGARPARGDGGASARPPPPR